MQHQYDDEFDFDQAVSHLVKQAAPRTPSKSTESVPRSHYSTPQGKRNAVELLGGSAGRASPASGGWPSPAAEMAVEPVPVRAELLPEQLTGGYRYMDTGVGEAADVLDERVAELGAAVQAANGWDVLADPGRLSVAAITSAGRICSDTARVGGATRLTDQTLVLETSRDVGNGERVALDLKRLAASGMPYALFPGQIVGVRGSVKEGPSLELEQIYDAPLLPRVPPLAADDAAARYRALDAHLGRERTPLSILVAAGPFTAAGDLEFAPLEALVERVAAEAPTVVIMLGPFIDVMHPLVQSGSLEDSPEHVFATQISPRLARIPADRTRVVLVPSVRDVVSSWITFPQPALDACVPARGTVGPASAGAEARQRAVLGLPAHVQCVANPSQFRILDVSMAVCNVDVLRQLGAQEVHRGAAAAVEKPTHACPTDRLGRLVRHLLVARSLYPLYPPPGNDAAVARPADANEMAASMDAAALYADAVPLDLARSAGADLAGLPDVLILPSLLNAFCKTVEGVAAVNPGSIGLRGEVALITVAPPGGVSGAGAENQVPGNVAAKPALEPSSVPQRIQAAITRVADLRVSSGAGPGTPTRSSSLRPMTTPPGLSPSS